MACSRKKKLTMEEIDKIRTEFSFFDKDGNGKISKKELGKAMRSLGERFTKRELADMIDEVDEDGDGQIDFEEFFQMMTNRDSDYPEDMREFLDNIREAFSEFDKDGNGFITPKELKQVMSRFGVRLNKRELNEMISELDLDGDGMISYEEFILHMTEKDDYDDFRFLFDL